MAQSRSKIFPIIACIAVYVSILIQLPFANMDASSLRLLAHALPSQRPASAANSLWCFLLEFSHSPGITRFYQTSLVLQLLLCGLFLWMAAHLLHTCILSLPRRTGISLQHVYLAETAALLALGFHPGFQFNVLHPNPVLLEGVLFLFAAELSLHFYRKPSLGKGCLYGTLTGLLSIESAWLLFFLPVHLFILLLRLWDKKLTRMEKTGLLMLPFISFSTGLFFSLLLSHLRLNTQLLPTGLADFSNWNRFQVSALIQEARSRFFFPGWILIAASTVLAGGILRGLASRQVNRRYHSARACLLILLLVTQLCVLSTPFRESISIPHFTLLPWFLSALNIGICLVLLAGWMNSHLRKIPLGTEWGWRILYLGVSIVPVTQLLSAEPTFSTPSGSSIFTLVQKEFSSPSPPTILISNGFLDDWFNITAYDHNTSLTILHPANMGNPRYRIRMEQILPALSTAPFRLWTPSDAAEWIRNTPEIASTLSILDPPDPWFASHYTPVPSYLGYRGIQKKLDHQTWHEMHQQRAFWKKMHPDLLRLSQSASPLQHHAQYLLALASRQFNHWGLLLEEQDAPAEAERAYTFSIELLPDNLSAAINLAYLKNPMMDHEALQTLLLHHPGDLPGFASFIRRYGHLHRPEAIQDLAEISLPGLKAETSSPKATAETLYRAGRMLFESGRLDAARAVYTRLLERGDHPAVLNNLAWIALQQGNLLEAEARVQHSLQLLPDNAAALDTLGMILLIKKQPEEALNVFTRAAAYSPDQPEIRQHKRLAEQAVNQLLSGE